MLEVLKEHCCVLLTGGVYRCSKKSDFLCPVGCNMMSSEHVCACITKQALYLMNWVSNDSVFCGTLCNYRPPVMLWHQWISLYSLYFIPSFNSSHTEHIYRRVLTLTVHSNTFSHHITKDKRFSKHQTKFVDMKQAGLFACSRLDRTETNSSISIYRQTNNHRCQWSWSVKTL